MLTCLFFFFLHFWPLVQRIEPYALNNINQLNGHSETKSSSGNITVLNEITAKARLSVSQDPDPLLKETKSLGRLSLSQDSDPLKEGKYLACIFPFSFYNFSLCFFVFFPLNCYSNSNLYRVLIHLDPIVHKYLYDHTFSLLDL